MRHIARALGSVVLVIGCTRNLAAADSTGSKWWPFGRHDGAVEAKVAQPPSLGTAGSTPLATPRTSGVPSAPLAKQTQLPNAPADAAPKERWMFKSRTGKVSWPHLTKPQAPSTGLFAEKKPTADAARNSWAEQTPAPPKPSPLKPITDGARKVSTSTKNAWHKTIDALTPGDPTPAPRNGSRIAKRDVEPSFWKRMFGAQPEPQGSQTVPEFMAQRRLDP